MSPADVAGLRLRIEGLYRGGMAALSGNGGEDPPTVDGNVLLEAIRRVYRLEGRVDPGIMEDSRVRALVGEYDRVFSEAVRPTLESGAIPPVMAERLREDVFVFSGFKTYRELRDVSALLLDREGRMKSFDRFYRDIEAIREDYNRHWLKAEYVFAQASAEMAAKWKDFEEDGDRYNLQYRTAYDDRVRPEHAALHGITLPVSDRFWDEFFPPNGWRCRCTVVRVRKGKYPESDSAEAIRIGRAATYRAGRNGVNKGAMFRFNPGKQAVIFPPQHPYYEVSERQKGTLMEKLRHLFSREVKSGKGLAKRLNEVAGKDWFVRPLEKILVDKNPRRNGATDMNGTIWLRKEILKDCIDAVNNIENGKDNTFEQERSMATLWHEITHNKNKPGNILLSPLQRNFMELANEFVARNTLPELFNALGGKLIHEELTVTRTNTGYNRWVLAYQKIIDDYGLDKGKVVSHVKEHLFNKTYDTQREGLADALRKASEDAIAMPESYKLVDSCLNGI